MAPRITKRCLECDRVASPPHLLHVTYGAVPPVPPRTGAAAAAVSKPGSRLKHPTTPAGGIDRDRKGLLSNANANGGINIEAAEEEAGSGDGEGTGDEEGTSSREEEGKEESDGDWGDAAGLGPGAPG